MTKPKDDWPLPEPREPNCPTRPEPATIRELLDEANEHCMSGHRMRAVGCINSALALLDNAETLMDYPGYRLVPDPASAP